MSIDGETSRHGHCELDRLPVGAPNKANLLNLFQSTFTVFRIQVQDCLAHGQLSEEGLLRYFCLRPESSSSPNKEVVCLAPCNQAHLGQRGTQRSGVGSGQRQSAPSASPTNDPASQLLFHLLALRDLLMNSDADSHLAEVRSLGCSFFLK